MPHIINIRTEVSVNNEYKGSNNKYPMNDLQSVYTHWSPELHKNVITENKLKGDVNNGKSSK